MNYYEILGISPSATTAEIKEAYRNKAKDYHPDKLMGIPDAVRKLAEEEFKKINIAYNTLNDPTLRESYDTDNGIKEAKPKENPTYKSPEKLELIRQIKDLRTSGNLGELNSAAKIAKELFDLDNNDRESRELYVETISQLACSLAGENEIDEAIRLLETCLKITQNPEVKATIVDFIEQIKPQGKLKTFVYLYTLLSIRNKKTDVFGFLPLKYQEFYPDTQNGIGKYYAVDFSWSDTKNIPPIEMVYIEGGSFIMGSAIDEIGHKPCEEPRHRVTISSFYMSKYPITRIQWNAVAKLPKFNKRLGRCSYGGSDLQGVYRNAFNDQYSDTPIPTSWYDAKEFCDRLSTQTRLSFRLPSEAEWEYACRAGTSTPFHFGRYGSSDLANYKDVAYGCDISGNNKFLEIGYKAANQFGVYFMHGNICEWCLDDWHNNYNNAPTDGSAWVDQDDSLAEKVYRGGQHDFCPDMCRSASRCNIYGESAKIGFRIVCQSV